MIVVGTVLFLALAYLSYVDFKSFRLPNYVTLPLIPAGFLYHTLWPKVDSVDGLMPYFIGAIIGYGFVFLLRHYYLRARDIEAIGLGDAKLLAASGAWLGWAALPYVLLIAAFSALLYVGVRHILGTKTDSKTAIPFGPFLALGFWLVWLSQNTL